MKLYYSPGACSLSPHIVLNEAGFSYDSEAVDLKAKKTKSGADFLSVNPKGQVPTLVLDDGKVLTEGPAIVQYLADQRPDAGLVPRPGTFERYRLQEWLNFISTELHKGFSPLFNPKTPDEYKLIAKERLTARIAYVAQELGEKQYLFGEKFTVADAYLFTVLNWASYVKIDLGAWPALSAYQARVAARPAVQAALATEKPRQS